MARQVFGDTLNLDEIRLTSLGGASGRGFTARGIDGKIYLNLGRRFSAPMAPGERSYQYPGQLLIHELTHAWQIQHGSFLPGLMCSMLVTQAENTFVDDVYAYGPPGPPWDELNPEQQASIVDQWYAGSKLSDGWASMDQLNPYYRYIWDNVLGLGRHPQRPRRCAPPAAAPSPATCGTRSNPARPRRQHLPARAGARRRLLDRGRRGPRSARPQRRHRRAVHRRPADRPVGAPPGLP